MHSAFTRMREKQRMNIEHNTGVNCITVKLGVLILKIANANQSDHKTTLVFIPYFISSDPDSIEFYF